MLQQINQNSNPINFINPEERGYLNSFVQRVSKIGLAVIGFLGRVFQGVFSSINFFKKKEDSRLLSKLSLKEQEQVNTHLKELEARGIPYSQLCKEAECEGTLESLLFCVKNTEKITRHLKNYAGLLSGGKAIWKRILLEPASINSELSKYFENIGDFCKKLDQKGFDEQEKESIQKTLIKGVTKNSKSFNSILRALSSYLWLEERLKEGQEEDLFRFDKEDVKWLVNKMSEKSEESEEILSAAHALGGRKTLSLTSERWKSFMSLFIENLANARKMNAIFTSKGLSDSEDSDLSILLTIAGFSPSKENLNSLRFLKKNYKVDSSFSNRYGCFEQAICSLISCGIKDDALIRRILKIQQFSFIEALQYLFVLLNKADLLTEEIAHAVVQKDLSIFENVWQFALNKDFPTSLKEAGNILKKAGLLKLENIEPFLIITLENAQATLNQFFSDFGDSENLNQKQLDEFFKSNQID